MRVVTYRGATRSPPLTRAPGVEADGDDAGRWVGRELVWVATVAGAVVFGASLALSRRTGMWLDEAQTLSIARLPLRDMFEALRGDGAPPLYYVVLHGWMAVVGTSETAVRSLSGVFAVAAVALTPVVAARLGGRRVAMAATLLVVTAPFLHRYATEARMYTLVVVLTVAGLLVLHTALERPSKPVLAGVAAVTGLLLLTHYWSFFLVVVVGAVLAARTRAGGATGAAARRALAAMAAGSLLFLPWVPSFLFQLGHTGAPWGEPASTRMFEDTLRAFVGGRSQIGLLGFVYLVLAALGLFGRALAGGRVELDLSGRPGGRGLAVATGGTLALALAVSRLSGNAFAPRYAAVVLVPFLLLAARGLAVVEDRRALAVLVSVVALLGLVRSADEAGAPRTQARRLASTIVAKARPGDLVAFCPDQLAPAVARLVSSAPVTLAAFPPGATVDRVDWVDYVAGVRAGDGRGFARSLHRRAGSAAVWLAWAPGYHGLGRSCEAVLQGLRSLRPTGTRVVATDFTSYEHASLWRFPSPISEEQHARP